MGGVLMMPSAIDHDILSDMTEEAWRAIDAEAREYVGAGQGGVPYRSRQALAYTVTTIANLLVEFMSVRDCDVVVGLVNQHLARCETPYRLQPVARGAPAPGSTLW
jgi:hypothetical protein